MARRSRRPTPAAPSPSPTPTPRADDLVVAPSGERWVVGPYGSRAQVSFGTLEAAVAHARAFAAARSLDVWLTRDHVAYARDGGDVEPGAVGGRRAGRG